MFGFILTATGTTGSGNSFLQLLPSFGLIIVLVVAFYFMLIRPQRKREKEESQMRNSLSVGDEITTTGGIVGKILSISDETVVIGTSGNCTMLRIMKTSIARIDKKIGEPEKAEEKK